MASAHSNKKRKSDPVVAAAASPVDWKRRSSSQEDRVVNTATAAVATRKNGISLQHTCHDNDNNKNFPQQRNNKQQHPSRRRNSNESQSSTQRKNQHHHNSETKKKPRVLWWNAGEAYVPLEAEQDMMKVLLRWGAKERGMLKDQPDFRQNQIRHSCQKTGMTISQACSLRRHHMCQLNPKLSKPQLKLGQNADIRESAAMFEQCIQNFLQTRKIFYYSEQAQKNHFYKHHPGEAIPGTPDFKLKEPLVLKLTFPSTTNDKTRGNKNNNHTRQQFPSHNSYHKNHKNNHKPILYSTRTIHWLEAKMFYGASTIPADGKSAVGSILPKMKTYVDLYGEGAIIFLQGCGDQLAFQLQEMGVTALTCTHMADLDLRPVHQHQKTWCANAKGCILP